METEKRIQLITWLPGLGECWKFRLPKFKGIVPCRDIRRIVADEDNESVRVIFGHGGVEKTLVVQGSLDWFIDTITDLNEESGDDNADCF